MMPALEKACSTGEPVDMQDLFFRFTLDVFAFIAFGVDLNSQAGEAQHPFAKAFDSVQWCTAQRIANMPVWYFRKWAWLAFEPERRLRSDVKVLDAFCQNVIASKRRLAADGAIGPDLISRFLEKAAKDGEAPPTDRELRDIVLNFIIAGRDTTACLLSWTMHELQQHPEVVTVILEELRNRIGDKKDFEYDDFTPSAMPYLHAVVSEALRLHPSVPKDMKFAVGKDTLPDGTPIVPGTGILYTPYAMARNPKLWPRPLSFEPERWLEDAEDGKGKRFVDPSVFKFVAFNAGPRLCLGKPLAYLEVKLMLSLLLRRFEFSQHPDIPVHDGMYFDTIVMPMKGGLKLKVTERSK
jgi:fatty acid omega-hydroxylase